MDYKTLVGDREKIRETLLELRDSRKKIEGLHKEVQAKYNAYQADVQKCKDFMTKLRQKEVVDLVALRKVQALIRAKDEEVIPTMLELSKIEETLLENRELRNGLVERGQDIKKMLKGYGELIPFPLRAPEEASESFAEPSDKTS